MKKTLQTVLAGGMMVASLVVGGLVSQPVLAAPTSTSTSGTTTSQVQDGVDAVGGKDNKTDLNAFLKLIINILLFIVGAVAVIMIIIGGISYVISGGDQSHVKAAKDTILYAVIGLVVALLAFAIVNFVLLNIK